MRPSSPLIVRPTRRLSGRVRLPGDKSLSHRALLFSALADGDSTVRNCLAAGVTDAMIDCLRDLGVEITTIDGAREKGAATADLHIRGRGLRGCVAPDRPLFCRGSATTMRLLAGVLACQSFESILDGSDRLRKRPMDRVVEPLKSKGANIITENGNAPLSFSPSRIVPSVHELPVASAQVKSALLLAGLYTSGSTTVTEPHASRDHTERLLRCMGLPLDSHTDAKGRHMVTLPDGTDRLPPLDMRIPGDPSSAAFLLVAGLLLPDAQVTVEDLCLNPGRIGLIEVLQSMGADLTVSNVGESNGEPTGSVTARTGNLQGTGVSGSVVARMIDEFPIFAVVSTQAHGITTVSGAKELRLKESDRIDALADELNRMGAGMVTLADGFVVKGPKRLRGAKVNARGDHRLAMSLIIAGLIADGETVVEGADVIHDSFPHFPEIMAGLGADLRW
ncbi:MAG: 3-phosphoshikimate 1-carboxyvinyltransferase [Desulfomonile sp.]|nr:3-phosphoshikimate 1-carboxyvinyltransferase [Desulfomonile sp.]